MTEESVTPSSQQSDGQQPPPVPEERRTIKMQKHSQDGESARIVFQGSGSAIGETSEISVIDKVIHAFGAIFHNTLHQSWLSVSDVNETLDRTYKILQEALTEYDELSFSVADGILKVNKEPYPVTTHEAQTFSDYLNKIEAHHFVIYSGMSHHEFTGFISILTLTPDELAEKGGFHDAVNAEEFKSIKAVKVFFQEITEEDTVVSKRELERKLEEQRLQAEADVLAMLQGEQGDDFEKMAASAHMVARDSGTMAGMIMDAAEKHHAASDGSQSKSASLVTCLRRAFNGLMKDPSLKTQKGKKALMKTLRGLEKEIHHQMGDAPDEESKEAISEAIETMEDEIRMDAIASEYTKRLEAIEQSEKKILRFIKSQGLDDVDDSDLALKLSEAGLDVSGWHALLAKSHASAQDREATETEDGALQAVGNLAALLTQLQDDTGGDSAQDEENKDKMISHLAEVDQEVRALTAATESKIKDLVADIASEGDDEKGDSEGEPRGQRMPRKKLLHGIAEIAQEVCQPLSVVTCSLNVVTSKSLGDVPAGQLDMLQLASGSLERIQKLMNALMQISGVPDNLNPDTKIQDAVYSNE